ncbi:MAG: hypothetical protein ABIR54_12395 [Burkholderiaceae bacterium]
MTRTSKAKQLSLSELTWFDLRNYPQTVMQQLTAKDWIRILRLRLTLWELATDDPATTLSLFKKVIASPVLAEDDAPLLHRVGHHGGDTGSVWSSRLGELEGMHKVAADISSDPALVYDAIAPANEASASMAFQSLRVDFRAGPTQIKSDFDRWLAFSYGSKASPPENISEVAQRRWATNKYLPYYDLKLFARARGMVITEDDIFDLLEFGEAPDGPGVESVNDKLKLAMTTFVQATVSALLIQAEGFRGDFSEEKGPWIQQ